MTNANLIHKYIALKLAGTSNKDDLSFRVGYYVIAEVEIIKRDFGKDILKAKAFYSDTPDFIHFIPVEVNLSPLWNKYSEGYKSLLLENLLGMIIKIESVEFAVGTYNGKPFKTFKIAWEFLGAAKDVVKHYRLIKVKNERSKELARFEKDYDSYLADELEIISLIEQHEGYENEQLHDKYLMEENELEQIAISSKNEDDVEYTVGRQTGNLMLNAQII